MGGRGLLLELEVDWMGPVWAGLDLAGLGWVGLDDSCFSVSVQAVISWICFSLLWVPTGSPSHGGDVTVFV